MGGFEGGDEAGFWDIDTLPISDNKKSKHANKVKSDIEICGSLYSIKAHAKVTIFLKITGQKDERFTLLSRVMRVEDLYDTISFVPCICESFTVEGCDEIPIEANTIYKAYRALIDYTADTDIEEFFNEHKVVVTKGIPFQAGLGGASSDAAAFMCLLKEACNLVLSSDELAKIGSSIDADLPFFIYSYPSANVSGFGEIVEPVEEKALKFEFYTPNVKCDTNVVCQALSQERLKNISVTSFSGWDKLDSKSILKLVSDPAELNDLYAASLLACPELKKEAKEAWFFSGSSFFKPLD